MSDDDRRDGSRPDLKVLLGQGEAADGLAPMRGHALGGRPAALLRILHGLLDDRPRSVHECLALEALLRLTAKQLVAVADEFARRAAAERSRLHLVTEHLFEPPPAVPKPSRPPAAPQTDRTPVASLEQPALFTDDDADDAAAVERPAVGAAGQTSMLEPQYAPSVLERVVDLQQRRRAEETREALETLDRRFALTAAELGHLEAFAAAGDDDTGLAARNPLLKRLLEELLRLRGSA